MKRITALALSLLGYASFAQSTQIGFETGTVAYFNAQYLPIKVYKNWQRANFNNGVFIRRETKGRWITSFEASYCHNINRGNQTIHPHGYPTDYLQTKYVSNVITLSYSLQYRLNKALKKVDNYIGLVYTRSFNSGQYSFHQISPVSRYSVPVSYD